MENVSPADCPLHPTLATLPTLPTLPTLVTLATLATLWQLWIARNSATDFSHRLELPLSATDCTAQNCSRLLLVSLFLFMTGNSLVSAANDQSPSSSQASFSFLFRNSFSAPSSFSCSSFHDVPKPRPAYR